MDNDTKYDKIISLIYAGRFSLLTGDHLLAPMMTVGGKLLHTYMVSPKCQVHVYRKHRVTISLLNNHLAGAYIYRSKMIVLDTQRSVPRFVSHHIISK